MAFQIINNHGIFEISGNIIAENAKSLQHHFEKLLFHRKQVIVSVDHVNKIDKSGVNALTNLYKKAIKGNKILCIIGKENKEVKKAFGKANYILRSDFV